MGNGEGGLGMITRENEIAALEYLKRYKVERNEVGGRGWDKRERLYKGVWITLNVLIGIAMVALIWA